MVRGYQLYNGEYETLFAVCQNGSIYTCVREYSNTFNEKTNVWELCDKLPEDATFIGSYKSEIKRGVK